VQDTVAVASQAPDSGAISAPVRAADRLGSVIEVLLLSGFPTQLTIGLGLAAAGLAPHLADGKLSLEYILWVWLLDAVVIFTLVVVLAHARGDSVRRVLLASRPAGREALIGLALVPVVFGIVVLALSGVRSLFPSLHNVPTNPFEELIRSPREAALLGVMAVVSGGIKEEVQRAFVLRRFEQHLGGGWVGLVVFSVAFGAGHFLQGWDVGVVTTLLGAFWGMLYLRRRSVVAAAVSHSGFNVAQILQFLVLGS